MLYLFFLVFKDILASQLTFPIFPSWFQLNGALCLGQGLAWPAGGTQSVSWCLPWCFRCSPSGSCWRGPSPTTFRSRGEAAIARGDQWKSNGMWPGVQEIWCSTIGERLPWSEVIGFGRSTLKFSPELRYVASSSFFEEFREERWCFILPG